MLGCSELFLGVDALVDGSQQVLGPLGYVLGGLLVEVEVPPAHDEIYEGEGVTRNWICYPLLLLTLQALEVVST